MKGNWGGLVRRTCEQSTPARGSGGMLLQKIEGVASVYSGAIMVLMN